MLPFLDLNPALAPAPAPLLATAPQDGPAGGDEIVINHEGVQARTPEGAVARMPTAEWLGRVRPPPLAQTGMLLPDGVRAVVTHPSGRGMVWVAEIPPRVWSVDWLAADSPADFGPGAKYLRRSLAFPYQVLLTTFGWGGSEGGAGLGLERRRVELFWRKAPLASFHDELRYPALLNVTKFFQPADPEYEPAFASKPLSWLCTQHLVVTPDMRSAVAEERLRAGYRQLMALVAGQSFNRSSENHPGEGEQMSWYTWSVRQGVDPRLADTALWEEASRRDPFWVLDVDWLPVGLSLGAVIDRIFTTTMGLPPAPRCDRVEDLSRIVFQHGQNR